MENLENIATTCRICFKTDDSVVNRINPLHQSIIQKLSQEKFIITANTPNKLCHDCLRRLLDANYFRELIVASNQALQELIEQEVEEKQAVLKDLKVEKDRECLENYEQTLDVIEEDDNQNENDNHDGDETIEGEERFSEEDTHEVEEATNQIEIISSAESQVFELVAVPQTSTADLIILQTLSCCMCSENFTEEIELLEHTQIIHQVNCLINESDEREFLCRYCGLEFTCSEELQMHKTCDTCLLTYHTIDQLQEHKEEYHSETQDKFDIKEYSNESKKLITRQSTNNKSNKQSYKGRRVKVEASLMSFTPTNFPCCLCATVFDSEAERLEHCAKHGFVFDQNMTLNPEAPKCFFCSKSFFHLSAYYSHFEECCRLKNRCDICGRKFLFPEQLSQHSQNVHSSKTTRYECFKCSLSFQSSSAYYSHNHRYHSERIRYQCELCSKTFLTPSKLQEHMNIHQDIKPFICAVCKKGFVRKDNLKNHMRLHSGEKPFLCSYCNKTFSHLTDKKRHEWTHTGNYPFKCGNCGQGFVKQSGYDAHTKNGVEKCKFKRDKTVKKIEDENSQDPDNMYKVIFVNHEPNPDNLYSTSDVMELDVMNEVTA